MSCFWKATWLVSTLMWIGVSGVPAKSRTTVTLRLWQGFKDSEVTLLRQQIHTFCEEWQQRNYRGLVIVEEQVPFDGMSTRIRMAAPGGHRLLPDMAMVDANKMAELVYGGVLQDLEELQGIPPGGLEALRRDYSPGAYETNVVRWKGKDRLFGLPAQTTTLALFWNKDLFMESSATLKAAGLDPERAPVDWDELTSYSRAIGDPKKRRFGFAYNNSLWFTMPFINQYRSTFAATDSQGKWVPTTDDPRLVSAIRRKMNMYLQDKEVVLANGEKIRVKVAAPSWKGSEVNPDQGFKEQVYAMILTGPWNVDTFRKNKLNFGVAMIPRVPLDEARALGLLPPEAGPDSPEYQALSSSSIGGQNIVLLNTCEDMDVAFEFMRFITGEQVQREWAVKLGQIPTHRAAQKNLNLGADRKQDTAIVEVFMNQVNLARPWPRLPRSGQIETDIMNPNMDLVLQGRLSVEEALERSGREIKERILDPVNAAAANLEKGGNAARP
jgi:ABC-type glycerol-3-phosphate transport system substrate-binding protein